MRLLISIFKGSLSKRLSLQITDPPLSLFKFYNITEAFVTFCSLVPTLTLFISRLLQIRGGGTVSSVASYMNNISPWFLLFLNFLILKCWVSFSKMFQRQCWTHCPPINIILVSTDQWYCRMQSPVAVCFLRSVRLNVVIFCLSSPRWIVVDNYTLLWQLPMNGYCWRHVSLFTASNCLFLNIVISIFFYRTFAF